MHPEKNARADNKRKSLFLFKIISSFAGRIRLYFHISAWVFIGGLSESRFTLACAADSGESVSGMYKHAKIKPPTKMLNAKIDTIKWLMTTARIGDKANPNEKPASTIPNAGALHSDGITSDSEDKATAIQLTIPEKACDA
mmetsp:Transcript_380/g.710  ORF Transcript_380/g.710 Transcript_380/m.710 type:complete len:141 (-) Transcript_380:333-755(-)